MERTESQIQIPDPGPKSQRVHIKTQNLLIPAIFSLQYSIFVFCTHNSFECTVCCQMSVRTACQLIACFPRDVRTDWIPHSECHKGMEGTGSWGKLEDPVSRKAVPEKEEVLVANAVFLHTGSDKEKIDLFRGHRHNLSVDPPGGEV